MKIYNCKFCNQPFLKKVKLYDHQKCCRKKIKELHNNIDNIEYNFQEIILSRNYIFIDPSDLYGDIYDNKSFIEIKNYHSKLYENNEKIKYWKYTDILFLLYHYDFELAKLFLKININYPALLADIGRIVILYYFGGVYHDLKFTSNKNLLTLLNKNKGKIKFISESFIKNNTLFIRNSNMISMDIKLKILDDILKIYKQNLLINYNDKSFGSASMWNLGSKTYINYIKISKSKDIIQNNLSKNEFINYIPFLKTYNKKTWQTTNDYLFAY